MSCPEKFIIYKSEGSNWFIKFEHSNGCTEEIVIDSLPKGLEPNVWYYVNKIF